MDNNSLSWPQKGHLLFKPDTDWWNNAVVNFPHYRWEAYAQGYKLAADLLVEHTQKQRAEIDFLVYPIVFLYHQHIELRLKQITSDGYKLLNDEHEFTRTHVLTHLWREARHILEEVDPGKQAETLDAIESCIREFSKADNDSQGFRYPIKRDEKPSLPDDLSIINLRHLSNVIQRLAAFLEAACMTLSVRLEEKCECLAAIQEDQF